VMFDVGTGAYASHLANGVAWYFNQSYSWGFAEPLDGLQRGSCDTFDGLYPDRRICWHTGGNTLNGGYRCGTTRNLNTVMTGGGGYERVLFQTP